MPTKEGRALQLAPLQLVDCGIVDRGDVGGIRASIVANGTATGAGRALLEKAMDLVATPIDADGSTMYGWRHGELRQPMMLGEDAAAEGFASIIGRNFAGDVCGTIVFRTMVETEKDEVYVELAMLRCSPQDQGYGSALMRDLQSFLLEHPVIIGKDIAMLAYVLKSPRTRRFFKRSGFDFDLKGNSPMDRKESSALELLLSLYKALEARMLVRCNTTRLAWDERWKEAAALERSAQKLLARAERSERGPSGSGAEAVGLRREAMVAKQAAEAAVDELARADYTWNQDHRVGPKGGVAPAIHLLRIDRLAREDAEAEAEAAEAAAAKAAAKATARAAAKAAAKPAAKATAQAAAKATAKATAKPTAAAAAAAAGSCAAALSRPDDSDGSHEEVLFIRETGPGSGLWSGGSPKASEEEAPLAPHGAKGKGKVTAASAAGQRAGQRALAKGWAVPNPPEGSVEAAATDILQEGATVFAEYADECVWYIGTAVRRGPRGLRVRFLDGEVLTLAELESGEWRLGPSLPAHPPAGAPGASSAGVAAGAGASSAGVAAGAGASSTGVAAGAGASSTGVAAGAGASSASSAAAAGASSPLDLMADYGAEPCDDDPSLPRGWRRGKRHDGRPVYIGPPPVCGHAPLQFETWEELNAYHGRVQALAKSGIGPVGDRDVDQLLHGGARGRGWKRQHSVLTVPEPSARARPTPSEREQAPFVYGDWCHGAFGGFRVVCSSLGGLLVCACDTDHDARATYKNGLRDARIELDAAFHLDSMAHMGVACLTALDLICAGLPCPAFSKSRTVGSTAEGLDYSADHRSGKTIDQLLEALESRTATGCLDRAILIEEVVGLIDAMGIVQKLEQLSSIGFHYRVFKANALLYGCAIRRVRLAIVCFRDASHLARFGRGPAPTSAGAPLCSVLDATWNSFSNSPQWLWLNANHMHAAAAANALVVGMGTSETGTLHTKSNSMPIPQGDGGTFVCIDEAVAAQGARLSPRQLEEYKLWFVHNNQREPVMRRMHPTEELAGLGWAETEWPLDAKNSAGRTARPQYEAVGITIAPPMYRAFAARMLWAMGKPLPPGTQTAEASEPQVACKCSRAGVDYIEMVHVKPCLSRGL